MDEFKADEAAVLSHVSAGSPRWTGAPSIDLAHQLNEQCIDLVCEFAAASSPAELPQFILQNRALWGRLDRQARKRVASLPFVIVDLRFKDAEWWRQIMGQPLLIHAGPTFFSDLATEVLLFARQAAREDLSVAKTMFAMVAPVASLIVSLTLQQVRSIASNSTHELRVRWDHDPESWRELLLACQNADELSMAAARRQAKLLFCGELVGAAT